MSASPSVDVQPKPVGHLPLIRAIVDQLHIHSVIDEALPADPRSRVSDADCVTVMLLNILEGRVALYDMERWLARTDVGVLLGEGRPADAFNDARLAACLDDIADIGPETLFSRVVAKYLSTPGRPTTYSVHQDTTSISVQGAYAAYNPEDELAVPTYGYSKDMRPDLKQLVYGLSLHGSVGIPLVGTMFSGNMSDPVANRFHLESLATLLPATDDVTLVGDCKLVDRATVGEILEQHFHFVSLVPHSFAVRGELVTEVRAASEAMPELHRSPGRTKADGERIYRGRSVERAFEVGFKRPDGVTGHNDPRLVPLRFLVVESTQLEADEDEAIERKLAKEAKQFDASLVAASRRAYGCEVDAQSALDKIASKLTYHVSHVAVVAEEVALKRARRGRPRTDDVAPTATVYRLMEQEPLTRNDDAVARLRFEARHFVLITDHLDRVAWPDSRILAEYRHQHVVEGSTGFRWLKNIATVAPVFLHTPRRIAALGVVFLLALMVRNYIQFELRRRLAETSSFVPDRLEKPTQSPTTETAMIPFCTITVVHITLDGRPLARQLTPLPDAARTVLRMLGVDEGVFLALPARKMPTPTAETRGM